MEDTGHRGASAIVDVGHGTCDGSRAGDASEERCTQVGHSLTYEFLVGVVAVAAHTISHGGRQQRLYGTQHSDNHGCGEQTLQSLPGDIGHGERRDACLYLAELVADGAYMHVGVGIEEIHTHRHDDDGHQRSGNLLGHLGGESYDDDAQQSHGCCGPVDGVQILQIHSPFAQEVAWQLAVNAQSSRSFICVVKMVTAIPLVKPTTMG